MQRKNNIKILQIITKSNFGGAQKYVYELSDELQKQNFDILVAFGGNGILSEKLNSKNIRTVEIKNLGRDINILSDLKVFFEIISLIKKERPDVIHLHSSKIGAIGSFAARLCFILGIFPKIIFTIHGLAFNEDRGLISKIIIKKIYWLTVFLSHKSIAVSGYVKKQILEIPFSFIIKNKIKVVKNKIKPVTFYTKEESLNFISQKIGQDINNKKIIGTIAELHHVKGINYLINSAKELLKENPEIIFVVFGDGQEKENLQKQINDLGIENNFFLLGFVDNAYKYLKGLDVFVLPSTAEALGLVILEAKQADLKIVASRVGGIPEAIADYPNALFFESKNSSNLKAKIEEILNKGKIETKNSSDNFSLMSEEVINIYNN